MQIVLVVRNTLNSIAKATAIDIVVCDPAVRINVVIGLELELLPRITEHQGFNIAQHIAAIAAHRVCIVILDNDESVRIVESTHHVGFDPRSQTSFVVDRGLARLCQAVKADVVAVDTVAVPRFVVLVPDLGRVKRINRWIGSPVENVVSPAALKLVGARTTQQGVVAKAAV